MVARGMLAVEAQKMAEAIREQYGLNEPLPLQYINWMVGIITRGDFGIQLYYNHDVGHGRGRAPAAAPSSGTHLPSAGVGASASPWASSPRRGNTAGPTSCCPPFPSSA